LLNKLINKEKTLSKGTRGKKKKRQKSKQKTIPKSAKCTMGNPRRRKHKN
jgi:hypothetical protein